MTPQSVTSPWVMRNGPMLLVRMAIVLASMTALMVQSGASAAGQEGAAPAGKSRALTLEKVPGSSIPRIKLSAKAAERLGIQLGKIGEQLVVRTQMVSGLIVPARDKVPVAKLAGVGFGGFAQFATAPTTKPVAPDSSAPLPAGAETPDASELWLLVTLSPGEYQRLAVDKPARIFPLGTRKGFGEDAVALPTGMGPQEDPKRSMLSLYYEVSHKGHVPTINERVRVELQMSDVADRQKAVPYSAVYYDGHGAAWVYVSPAPLIYERRRIAIDRVVGESALLTAGPDVGTPVVTVGAALLYGTEVFKK